MISVSSSLMCSSTIDGLGECNNRFSSFIHNCASSRVILLEYIRTVWWGHARPPPSQKLLNGQKKSWSANHEFVDRHAVWAWLVHDTARCFRVWRGRWPKRGGRRTIISILFPFSNCMQFGGKIEDTNRSCSEIEIEIARKSVDDVCFLVLSPKLNWGSIANKTIAQIVLSFCSHQKISSV